MTKEELRNYVEEQRNLDVIPYHVYSTLIDGIDTLEQGQCKDCISRRDAIKKFTYNYKGQRIPEYDCDNWPIQIPIKEVKEILRDLPPATPQPKMGHWIKMPLIETGQTYSHECSLCGRRILVTDAGLSEFPYCHCGAKMVELREHESEG